MWLWQSQGILQIFVINCLTYLLYLVAAAAGATTFSYYHLVSFDFRFQTRFAHSCLLDCSLCKVPVVIQLTLMLTLFHQSFFFMPALFGLLNSSGLKATGKVAAAVPPAGDAGDAPNSIAAAT